MQGHIPKDLDRRYKLTDGQREEIQAKYSTGKYSQRKLADEYGVSKRLISFIIDKDKRRRSDEQLKERKAAGKHKMAKEHRAELVKNHRRYKQRLFLEGKLI